MEHSDAMYSILLRKFWHLACRRLSHSGGLMHIQELWSENREVSHLEIIGSLIRKELQKHTLIRKNMSYLGLIIEDWWAQLSNKDSSIRNINQLRQIIENNLLPEELLAIQSIGLESSAIVGILFENLFNTEDRDLALLVHEAMTRIAGVLDIKYPYEDHKVLFPKQDQGIVTDWGKGYGIIRPHSDDIYEGRDISGICLTVCKDITATPTWFWFQKDIVREITDEDLGYLAMAKATYISGTNVENKVIKSQKPILRIDEIEGLSLRLDFRIDDVVGPRMQLHDDRTQRIFDKMRSSLKTIKPTASKPSTGSVGILANLKILHGRGPLDFNLLSDGENSRSLFRSKGIR